MRFARSTRGLAFGAGPVANKAVDVSIERRPTQGINLHCRLATHCDHAGLSVYLEWLGFEFEFEFYDVRHWDEENGRYFKAGERLQRRREILQSLSEDN